MKKQQFIALMYGWIVILGLILLTSFVLGLLLRFTSMDETTLSWVSLAVGLIALFIGGIVAGVKGKKKGWVIGAITGLGFTLFTFLVQYLGYQQTFSLEQSLHHAGFVAAALVGGVIGVNIFVADKKS
ncbi:TIGR04086 family membrane protein [Lentibacillus sp. Marseille-P4043]|uniref:TIGR04086 family membrane protein n=1 Tax=Lentibacillus sp. Marseille-P4043 TaxID=2040293 RepID=UPI000D0B2AFE|nr:TIGR04086 family membrane protein [Lentibacillus sp. Marseille-P4043]